MEDKVIRLLTADEIECRVGTISEKGLSLLLYKDARADMKILDEVFGPKNWQRTHEVIGGNLYCNVQIYDEQKKQWISKMDVGTESYTEKEKGQASDSFKRACVSVGIGRELYTAPFIWIPASKCNIQPKDNRFITYDKFRIKEITYNDNREITGLTILNQDGKVVYSLSAGKTQQTTQSESEQPATTPPSPVTERMKKMNKELERTGVALDMQVLFNVLMGLRRSEINGLKYSDVDYVNRTLKVERQLGRVHNADKEDFAPKTLTKQEVGLKTDSSYRELPIPDIVFEAILEERQKYERNRSRRINDKTTPFFDGNYICCSTYGRPRSKGFHWKYYKQLLSENGLPDIRWHDLRTTYCTLLLKESFNPKAVSKLMGHAKEIITMDTYGDNQNIIADGVPEMEAYMKEVLPDPEAEKRFRQELLEIVMDVSEYLPELA